MIKICPSCNKAELKLNYQILETQKRKQWDCTKCGFKHKEKQSKLV